MSHVKIVLRNSLWRAKLLAHPLNPIQLNANYIIHFLQIGLLFIQLWDFVVANKRRSLFMLRPLPLRVKLIRWRWRSYQPSKDRGAAHHACIILKVNVVCLRLIHWRPIFQGHRGRCYFALRSEIFTFSIDRALIKDSTLPLFDTSSYVFLSDQLPAL